jgi:hypothetical protein
LLIIAKPDKAIQILAIKEYSYWLNDLFFNKLIAFSMGIFKADIEVAKK